MKTNVLLAVLLALLAMVVSRQNFKKSKGCDFYQIWGVSKAQQLSGGKLKSPYVEMTRYAAVINSYAEGSNDSRLKRANQIINRMYPKGLDLTGTPLCYLTFLLLPKEYSYAFAIYDVLQIILFIISVVILNSVSHENRLGLVSLAFLLVAVYDPLLSNLRVGNLSSFQLFGLTLLVVFADSVLSGSSARDAFFPCVVFMCTLFFLALLKPNLILVMLLLSAYLWALHGTKVFAPAVTAGAIFGAILMALPCIYFGSWRVWLDWYSYINIGSGKLLYPISQGNFATVLLASQALGISVSSAIVIVAAMLFILSLGALIIASSSDGSGLKGMWEAVVRSLRDPYLCMAVGITVTLALSPLVWHHYYVISLIPALWLLTAPHRWSHIGVLGGLSIVLTSGLPALLLIRLFEWVGLFPYSIAMGLIPLWAGILVVIASKKKTSPADSSSPAFS